MVEHERDALLERLMERLKAVEAERDELQKRVVFFEDRATFAEEQLDRISRSSCAPCCCMQHKMQSNVHERCEYEVQFNGYSSDCQHEINVEGNKGSNGGPVQQIQDAVHDVRQGVMAVIQSRMQPFEHLRKFWGEKPSQGVEWTSNASTTHTGKVSPLVPPIKYFSMVMSGSQKPQITPGTRKKPAKSWWQSQYPHLAAARMENFSSNCCLKGVGFDSEGELPDDLREKLCEDAWTTGSSPCSPGCGSSPRSGDGIDDLPCMPLQEKLCEDAWISRSSPRRMSVTSSSTTASEQDGVRA